MPVSACFCLLRPVSTKRTCGAQTLRMAAPNLTHSQSVTRDWSLCQTFRFLSACVRVYNVIEPETDAPPCDNHVIWTLKTSGQRYRRHFGQLILPTLCTLLAIFVWAALVGSTYPESQGSYAVFFWTVLAPGALGLICTPFWFELCQTAMALTQPGDEGSQAQDEFLNRLSKSFLSSARTGLITTLLVAWGIGLVVLPGLYLHYRFHRLFFEPKGTSIFGAQPLAFDNRPAVMAWTISIVVNVLGAATLIGLFISLPYSALVIAQTITNERIRDDADTPL